jgi:hypothetical protein
MLTVLLALYQSFIPTDVLPGFPEARTNGVPSDAELPVPVVPTQRHPFFDGSAGPGAKMPLIDLGAAEPRAAS